ncbi:MAG: DUF420 domain-containing protein [Phycisphaerae bacterium]
MIELTDLPTVNAVLNATSLALLATGYAMVRRKHITAHKSCMIAAFCVSIVFLVSYVTYRCLGEEKRFTGTGWIRPVYFFILLTHVPLAATVPVLGTWTLIRGLRGPVHQHRRIARITLPIWLYVSVTGVLVYVLLFVVYGPAPGGAVRDDTHVEGIRSVRPVAGVFGALGRRSSRCAAVGPRDAARQEPRPPLSRDAAWRERCPPLSRDAAWRERCPPPSRDAARRERWPPWLGGSLALPSLDTCSVFGFQSSVFRHRSSVVGCQSLVSAARRACAGRACGATLRLHT